MVVFTEKGRRLLSKRIAVVTRELSGGDGGYCISEYADGVWVDVRGYSAVSNVHAAVAALRLAFDGLQFGLKFGVDFKPSYYTDGRPAGLTVSVKLHPRKIDQAAKDPRIQEWLAAPAAV